MKIYLLLGLFIFLSTTGLYADTVIWSGDVDAQGNPSEIVKLTLGKKYQIQVSGTMRLGKWYKNGLPVRNDSCYEFNEKSYPHLTPAFKNSMNLSICEEKYNEDHIYKSKPFIAAQNAVHFWIYDTNYEDNTDSLHVEVIQLDN